MAKTPTFYVSADDNVAPRNWTSADATTAAATSYITLRPLTLAAIVGITIGSVLALAMVVTPVLNGIHIHLMRERGQMSDMINARPVWMSQAVECEIMDPEKSEYRDC